MAVEQASYLKTLNQQLDDQIQQVNQLAALSEGQLHSKSSNGGWSPAECLDHLHKTYELYRPRVDEILASLPEKSGPLKYKSSWLGRSSVKNTGPDAKQRIKMKMKTFAFFQPDEGISFNEAQKHLADDLAWHRAILQSSKNKDLHVKVQSASKWIKFRMGDAYAFLLAHNARHLLQAERSA